MTNFNTLAKDLHNEFIISNIIKTKLTRLLIFMDIYMIILNVNILLTSSIIILILITNLANKYNINHNFKSYHEITSYLNKNQT